MSATTKEHVVNRDGWPAGPWDGEPDKDVWVDESTNLDCMIVRNPLGAWCGYVGVPPTHPWHRKGYSECVVGCDEDYCYEHSPEARVDVHGGLTYSAACMEQGPICHVAEPGRDENVWWFGFDTAHAWDLTPRTLLRFRAMADETYRDLAYIKAETALLARQLAEVAA